MSGPHMNHLGPWITTIGPAGYPGGLEQEGSWSLWGGSGKLPGIHIRKLRVKIPQLFIQKLKPRSRLAAYFEPSISDIFLTFSTWSRCQEAGRHLTKVRIERV